MRWQDVPSRDDVEEVMSRKEFQYPKSLWERIQEWFAERLDDIFGRSPDLPVSGPETPSSFGGGIGPLIGWILIIVAVAVVIFVIVIVVRNWVGRVSEEEEPLSETELEHRRRAAEWAGEAASHEAKLEWKLAVRARYRELVRTLTDRHQVVDLAGRTTGELRTDLAATTPTAEDDFDTACLLFELPWYADVPTGEDENRRFKAAATAVLAAPVQHRVGDVPAAALATLRSEGGAGPGGSGGAGSGGGTPMAGVSAGRVEIFESVADTEGRS